MSDGITDSYRDQRRAECYDDFLKILVSYLENQTEENFKRLKSTAESVDGVPRGLMTGQTSFAKGLDQVVARLIENDPRIWGRLLLTAVNSYPNKVYKRLKKLSPFAGKILIEVDYGIGFVNLRGEIQPVLDQIIGTRDNLKVYDADRYLVIIPESALAEAEVNWLRCGYYQIKEPRKARQK